jgi:hypothetical protein
LPQLSFNQIATIDFSSSIFDFIFPYIIVINQGLSLEKENRCPRRKKEKEIKLFNDWILAIKNYPY